MQLKSAKMCLESQQRQPKDRTIPHKLPGKPWEVPGVYLFQANNKNFLCIANYCRNILTAQKVEILSADILVACYKVVLVEYGLPRKITLDIVPT